MATDGVQMYVPTMDAGRRGSDFVIPPAREEEEDDPCCDIIVLPRPSRPPRPARAARKCQCNFSRRLAHLLCVLLLCSPGIGMIMGGVSLAGSVRECRANRVDQALPTNVTSTSDGGVTYATGTYQCTIIVFTPPTVHVGDQFHIWWSPNRAHCALEEDTGHCDTLASVLIVFGVVLAVLLPVLGLISILN
jgi:hypothetical protein